jgi:hypothetical protein
MQADLGSPRMYRDLQIGSAPFARGVRLDDEARRQLPAGFFVALANCPEEPIGAMPGARLTPAALAKEAV